MPARENSQQCVLMDADAAVFVLRSDLLKG